MRNWKSGASVVEYLRRSVRVAAMGPSKTLKVKRPAERNSWLPRESSIGVSTNRPLTCLVAYIGIADLATSSASVYNNIVNGTRY